MPDIWLVMKNILTSFVTAGLVSGILFTSCDGAKKKEGKTSEEVSPPAAVPVQVGNETSLLLKDLAENGDYVNSNSFPSLIKSTIVYENLGKSQLVIDIRNSEKFRKGHVRGSVNRSFNELEDYFVEGIKPFEYERIVLVCDDGQLSGYATCLLRLMGYGNVYAMRWGMSSWNKSMAEAGWLAALSGKYENKLDTVTHNKVPGASLPELNTGLASGAEIGAARFSKLFSEGESEVVITADEVFSDPSSYFVINLERKDKYEDGHIPGAVRYKPESTLGFTDEMASIPSDKTVVVYCGTGHNSAFATAYLRLFGYNARTLKYGNNSFMYDRMVSRKDQLSWLPFTIADVHDYEIVK
jgi:rhodanese-related sulfurtransferase